MENNFLNREEQELIESFGDEANHTNYAPTQEFKDRLKTAANDFVSSEKKMNIRIDSFELEQIKKRAAIEGLRYQTFVKSVLHKYITGQLVEK